MKSPISLSFLSGVLLALAFPYPGWGWLAWIALAPLLYAIRSAEEGVQALGYGAIAGAVFFAVSLHWLTHVTALGWILLVLIEIPYFMIFAWLVYCGKKARWPKALNVIWIASAWTVMEYIRSEMPVFGLGWNLLAYSQSAELVMIQSANLIGAYGLGFLIVIVNVCFSELLWPAKKRGRGTIAMFLAVILIILSGILFYGELNLKERRAPEEYLRVSALQGNIPQSLKWAPIAKEKIIEVYSKLTELASFDQVDLIVWPEAAFPGYLNRDVQGVAVSNLARSFGTPLLIGSLYWDGKKEAFNSAFFIDKTGAVTQRYDKLRLVPFGEYIPWKTFFFWLTPFADALGISDFVPGKKAVIFEWAREEWPFGVLICFEDVIPSLARDLAGRGAKFICVLTNDAWFGKTSAAHQHFQASIFRAVENGVPVVRAANTGISGMISYLGEVLQTLKGENGKEIFVTGQVTYDLPLLTKDTFYRKGGWLFPYFVFVFFLFLFIGALRKIRA